MYHWKVDEVYGQNMVWVTISRHDLGLTMQIK